MSVQRKLMLPLVLVFIFTNTLLIVLKGRLEQWGINRELLLAANCLFFVLNLLAFSLQRRALANPNPHAFTRSIMGSMFAKMLLVATAFFVYLMVMRKNVSKPSVFAALSLYIVYLVAEVATMLKLNRQQHG
jgi:hypothetical protein